MRRILLATAALALSAGSALAAGDSAVVTVNAEQEAICTIVEAGDVNLAGINVDVPGVFKYTCNFEGSPTFTFQSANGGVSNGVDPASDYGIYLNDTAPGGPPSGWLQASAALAPVPFPGISLSSPANSLEQPEFHLGLTAPLPVAGSYSDQLTITITP